MAAIRMRKFAEEQLRTERQAVRSTRGLEQRYRVDRLNDSAGKHARCRYFVLDLTHDEFAAPALRAYADNCAAKFPALARDLRSMFLSIAGFDPGNDRGDRTAISCSAHGPFDIEVWRATGKCPACDHAPEDAL